MKTDLCFAIAKLLLFSAAFAVVLGVPFWQPFAALALVNLWPLFVKGERTRGLLCIDLGTIASGVGTPTTVNLQYCPQQISWVQTAAVDVNIKVLGDGTTYDMVAAGITEMGVWRQLGRFTNQYILTLTDGLLVNKTTSITITNQVASAFTLYGASENMGQKYFKGVTQICLANSGVDFNDFVFISFPAAGATDQFTVTWGDGTNQAYRREELRTRTQRFQNVINTAGYNLDNGNKYVRNLNLIPAAQQSAYLMQVVRAKGTAASTALLARQ